MLTVSKEEIQEIVEIALDRDVEDFDMEKHFYLDYEMDSLGAVALVVEVQKKYGVRIPDERMPEVLNGNQLKAAIEDIAANPPDPNAEKKEVDMDALVAKAKKDAGMDSDS